MSFTLAANIAARRRFMHAITGKRPRRGRMPRAIQPKLIATGYTRSLLDLVGAMRTATHRDVFPQLERYLAHGRELKGRTDAIDDDIAVVKASLAQGAFSKPNLRAVVAPVGRRTADWQKEQLNRQLRAAVGVEVPLSDPRLADRITAFTDANVALITSIPEESLGQVQKLVLQAIGEGARFEDLAADIERRFDVAESRAALIARDQVGKFYGSLNEARQKDLGLTHFIWRVAHDERLCPICAPLDGKRFSWANPPPDGAPGEVHPNCRCNADPDVEGLLASL